MTGRGASLRSLRFVAPGAGLLLLALCAGLWSFDRGGYFAVMAAWGVPALDRPFADWAAVVHLMHCADRGVNVYVASGCGTFSYGPLWVWTRLIPLRPAWTDGMALAIDAAFFASLWFVFRPKSWGGAAVGAAISISPMVVYGAERANADLILFVLVIAAGVLFDGPGARRIGAYALLLLAALLKFYPVAGLFLLVRERPKAFVPVALALGATVALLAALFGHQLAAAVAALPAPRWTVDGAAVLNLWQGLQVLAPSRPLAVAMTLLVVAGAAVLTLRLARRPDLADALAAVGARERTLLVLGAAITITFYFLDQPIAYHGVFLLPAEAGLIALRRQAAARLKAPLTWAAAAPLILMWEPAVRDLILAAGPRAWAACWLAREVIGWGLIATLAAILARFALDGGVLLALRGGDRGRLAETGA
jgi:hypothetical protein